MQAEIRLRSPTVGLIFPREVLASLSLAVIYCWAPFCKTFQPSVGGNRAQGGCEGLLYGTCLIRRVRQGHQMLLLVLKFLPGNIASNFWINSALWFWLDLFLEISEELIFTQVILKCE